MLALEQVRIRAVQPSGDLCECRLVEPLFAGCRWVLSCLRAPAQDGIELDIRWLGLRLGEIDKTGNSSFVNHHVGSMYITMDKNGFVGSEQRQPLPDPVGDVGE